MTRLKVAIVGSSATGLNFSVALAESGVTVSIVEPDAHAAERLGHFLKRTLAGTGDPDALPAIVDDVTAVQMPDIVFEALDEPFDARLRMLSTLTGILPDTAIVATTDLRLLDVREHRAELAGVFGVRMFLPAHLRTLVEVVVSTKARPERTETLFSLLRAAHKMPMLAPRGRPSIGTRLERRLYEAADGLLMDGAVPFELDQAMMAAGFDMGVYEAQDLIGLDVAYADRKQTRAARDPARFYIPISDRMVEEGRLGKKVGVGWYRYPGGGGAVIDPLIEDLVREEAWFAGVKQRSFSATEMQDRLMLSLVHEGRAMLADGTAMTAIDIDRVCVAGLGFPADIGGAMVWADQKGAPWVDAELAKLAAKDPVVWAPAR